MSELICKNSGCDGEFHKVDEKISPCPIRYANRRIAALGISGKKFSDFKTTEKNKAAVEEIKTFISSPHNKLIIRGENGRGKTHLAYSVVIEYLKQRRQCEIVSDSEFVRACADLYGEGEERVTARIGLNRLKACPLLMYDDFGSRRYTAHALTVMQEILDKRNNHGLVTIFTTNLPGNKIRVSGITGAEADEWVNRIESRLHENSVDVTLLGKDYRRRVK